MVSEAQLPLDPAGWLYFSWGSCDSGWGRDFAQAREVGTEGLGRGKGMTDGPRGECQNHKSNLSLTPSSYKVYLHFHIASTSKTSMFRHFKTGWHVHILCHWALTKDRELGPVHPTLIWLSNHILPFDDPSNGIPKDPLLIASFYLSRSSLYSLVVTLDLEAFRTLLSVCAWYLVVDSFPLFALI